MAQYDRINCQTSQHQRIAYCEMLLSVRGELRAQSSIHNGEFGKNNERFKAYLKAHMMGSYTMTLRVYLLGHLDQGYK